MQKKITKDRVIDIIIVFFCLAGACISGVAFWREYNHTLVKLNEEPVATIIFKKRVAQRKFLERDVWDRLKQTSPVYHGDTIRTVEQAEAIIIFQDNITYLSMDENTIIQVYYNSQGGAKIDFSSGDLEVVSENENLEISSGTSTIVVAGQARINKDDEDFILSVSDGTASYDGKGIEAGGILALDANGGISTKPIIAMTSFGSSAYVLGSRPGVQGATAPVVFSWNTLNFDSSTYVVVEVARDRSFSSLVEARDVSGSSSVSIPLENGNYWWRAYPASSNSSTGPQGEPSGAVSKTPSGLFPSGSLEVIPVAPVALLSPASAEIITIPSDPAIPFSWSAVENVSSYLLEISAHPDMGDCVISRRVEANSVNQTGLDYGSWYWRVTPVYPLRFKGSVTPSVIGEFSIRKGSPVIAAPVLTFPFQNGNTYLDAVGTHLLWAHDTKAAPWLVELADNPNMDNPAVKKNVSNNYYPLSKDLFEEGKTWYWRITAMGGVNPAVSEVWNFTVTSGNRPVAKPVITTETYIPLSQPIVFGTRIEDWDDLDAETSASNERVLSQIVQILNTNSRYKVRVEGHANPTVDPSNVASRSLEYTQELQPISEIRARAVMNRLITLGIDPSRLEYRGLGGEHPLVSWEDTENWGKNRRVEFVLVR